MYLRKTKWELLDHQCLQLQSIKYGSKYALGNIISVIVSK